MLTESHVLCILVKSSLTNIKKHDNLTKINGEIIKIKAFNIPMPINRLIGKNKKKIFSLTINSNANKIICNSQNVHKKLEHKTRAFTKCDVYPHLAL